MERQCGVMLPNGQPCARSLTCKSHSMGAKRAVVGRSLPYDMLLAAYQKKNQAKQQSTSRPSYLVLRNIRTNNPLQRPRWMLLRLSRMKRKPTPVLWTLTRKLAPLWPASLSGDRVRWSPSPHLRLSAAHIRWPGCMSSCTWRLTVAAPTFSKLQGMEHNGYQITIRACLKARTRRVRLI